MDIDREARYVYIEFRHHLGEGKPPTRLARRLAENGIYSPSDAVRIVRAASDLYYRDYFAANPVLRPIG